MARRQKKRKSFKQSVRKMTIKQLKRQFAGGYRPGGYMDYRQTQSAQELRRRGYRVSYVYGTVKKKRRKY